MGPPAAGHNGPGFTLVELLTVVGIVGVLIGLLLPAVGHARRLAARTVCAARVRQLVAASQIHLNQFRRYPDPLFMPATGGVMPASVQTRLLGQMAGVLRLPDPAAATGLHQLPDSLVCPVRKAFDFATGVDLSLGTPFWQTGYMYTGGLERQPNAGVVLRPLGHAAATGTRRGVLWADSLVVSSYGGAVLGYGFYHAGGRTAFDVATKVSRTRDALEGQHRGYSDGSVEWVEGKSIAIDPAALDAAAGYRLSFGGAYTLHYVY